MTNEQKAAHIGFLALLFGILVLFGLLGFVAKELYYENYPKHEIGDCIALEGDIEESKNKTDKWIGDKYKTFSIHKIVEKGEYSYKTKVVMDRYPSFVGLDDYVKYQFNNIYQKIECPEGMKDAKK